MSPDPFALPLHPETVKRRFAFVDEIEATVFESKAVTRGWDVDWVAMEKFIHCDDAIEMCEEEIDFCMRMAHAESTKN